MPYEQIMLVFGRAISSFTRKLHRSRLEEWELPYNMYESILNSLLTEDAQQSSGAAVVPLNTTGPDPTFCCNSLFTNKTSGDLICGYVKGLPQTPFTVANGTAIPGVAALSDLVKGSNDTSSTVANDTSTSRTGSSITSNNSNDVAIGAGVGVPLGVVALLSIGWALWERRKRKRASLLAQPVHMDPLHPYQPVTNDRNFGVSELGAYTAKPAELNQNQLRG
ncbi:hypothetical protein N7516_003194 [Penicillium verrucosum]|uniref:uncharacterized protein n=1 Tax=Penicillium verrucosum TaxID=60171 RepID=UPI0025457056|nr:uncharacterized protein N7516_003194 [Penicillium verrucosum]KAJ5943026.1 hypothetical protein N7516_003194 [Penicillium verrucosum]